jgi:hypothetical protein
MLLLITLYFIGKTFYELAHEFDKGRWQYAIAGIVVFYLGQFLGGMLIGFGAVYAGYEIDNINELALGLLALPFGGLAVWLLYRTLKKRWSGANSLTSKDAHNEQIIDDELIP